MKKSIFLLAIFCALTFVSATQKSSAWGEDLRPWKVVSIINRHKIYNGDFIDGYLKYGNAYSIKYHSADSNLIYTIIDTVSSSEYRPMYKKTMYYNNLYTNSTTSIVLNNNPYLFPNFECLFSEDGNYNYHSDGSSSNDECYYALVNIKKNAKYTLGLIKYPKIFLKSNDFMVCAWLYLCLPMGKGEDVWNEGLIVYDTLGKQVAKSEHPRLTEYKPILFLDESPDGKYIAAYHSAPLDSDLSYDKGYYSFGEPTYLIGCYGHYHEYWYTKDTTRPTVGIFRIYKTDDISQQMDIYSFTFPTNGQPNSDSARAITKRNIPFRFSCGGKKLIMQNIFGQNLGLPGSRDWQYYCFSRDMENISETDHAPTDTFYLGYPLKNAYWVNNDKNVLILDDSTNHITVLETENYSIVNEINLRSINGRKLNLCRVYPEDDLIIGYNDPAGDTLGNIELFKISGIAGVNDEKPITSVLYPNPATQSATLELNLPSSNEIDLDISDLSGKILRTQNCGRLASGVNSIAINTSALSSGSYFVTARGNNYSKTFKLIINK